MAQDPQSLSILDFSYDLPADRIARYPLPQRDQSQLLEWRQGQVRTSQYAQLADFVPEKSLMVFNDTKVVEARLLFQKPGGGKIEVFCLEPDDRYADITQAMLEVGEVWWKCLVGGAKKWKQDPLELKLGDMVLRAEKGDPLGDHYRIHFKWDSPQPLAFAEVLHRFGVIPLPPYLNRAAEAADQDRYQTIYAQADGSVAAPTAGLHFTPAVFDRLKAKAINCGFITLHVGAGTFKPVKAAALKDHDMHAEYIDVDKGFIQQLIEALPQGVIAVGTTSLRTLESLYWLGVKTHRNPQVSWSDLPLQQWEVYALDQDTAHHSPLSTAAALNALCTWLDQQQCDRLVTKTQVLIAPGYRFRVIDALVTNFHQPQSTLLLLIAAIVGEDWRKIYQYALDHGFRFLSYGDGSLLWVRPEAKTTT